MSKACAKNAIPLVLISTIVNAGGLSPSAQSYARRCLDCSSGTPDARLYPKLQQDQGDNCCQDVCTGMRQSCDELRCQATCASPGKEGNSQHLCAASMPALRLSLKALQGTGNHRAP